MKRKLILILTSIALGAFPIISFGQAPNLGTAASFAVFTAVGAVSNEGASQITGDVGTNVGAFTGFPPAPPGTLTGAIHVVNPTSAQAAIDVAAAYTSLVTLPCGTTIGSTLGNGQTLTPGVYCIGAAATLNGTLTLDGQNNPNAVFIIKIDGPLSTTTLSNIVLINGASWNNVYFQVNGEVTLAANSIFRGTIIANGAIHLLEGAALQGRALSIAGAIDLHNNLIVNGAIPLPITLVSFTAKAQSNKVVNIAWTTSLETNNKGFLVERSKDLKYFDKVGEVSEIAANSSGLKSYRLTDETPYSGTSYYRLKQTDLSGKMTVYPAVSVVLRDEAYGVFPNPIVSDGRFVLRLDDPETALLSFYSLDGRPLPLQKIGGQSGNLQLKSTGKLSAGIYVLQVIERGQTRQHRLIVE